MRRLSPVGTEPWVCGNTAEYAYDLGGEGAVVPHGSPGTRSA